MGLSLGWQLPYANTLLLVVSVPGTCPAFRAQIRIDVHARAERSTSATGC
jgi:hypothetical protein